MSGSNNSTGTFGLEAVVLLSSRREDLMMHGCSHAVKERRHFFQFSSLKSTHKVPSSCSTYSPSTMRYNALLVDRNLCSMSTRFRSYFFSMHYTLTASVLYNELGGSQGISRFTAIRSLRVSLLPAATVCCYCCFCFCNPARFCCRFPTRARTSWICAWA
jgi:hypothetical protein